LPTFGICIHLFIKGFLFARGNVSLFPAGLRFWPGASHGSALPGDLCWYLLAQPCSQQGAAIRLGRPCLTQPAEGTPHLLTPLRWRASARIPAALTSALVLCVSCKGTRVL